MWSPQPPSLFSSSYMMLEANKPSLANAMWSKQLESAKGPNVNSNFILDGGALLHRIPWVKGTKWDEILQSYTRYVSVKYGNPTVVFDGYSNEPSIKDTTHCRRNGTTSIPVVQLNENMPLTFKKEQFLGNKDNKQNCVCLLGQKLEETGCHVKYSEGDADLLIVQEAVAAASYTDTILVVDDTDLLVLLIHHAKDTTFTVFFRPEKKQASKLQGRCWNIKELRSALGSLVCDNILFLHALLGCDTTSRIFGIGKPSALSVLKKSPIFCRAAERFRDATSRKTDITAAGEIALVALYGGSEDQSLNDLRHIHFCKKVSSSSSFVEPRILPPTSASAMYHSFRVYYQIQMWNGRTDLDAKEW